MTTLIDLPIGHSGTVIAIRGESSVARRLMEMGVIPGVVLTTVKSAPFGDPLEVRVRGYSLALRKREAAAVEVSFESPSAAIEPAHQ